MQWVLLTEYAPHQQAAAIAAELRGTARDLARTLSPNELTNGGVIAGQRLDPVSYIVAGLHMHYAAYDEELRISAMTDMLNFNRRPNESIVSMFARYDLVRNRAAQEGGFGMTIEGCALQIFKVTNTSTEHMVEYLRPFGGIMPRTEADFRALLQNMRRSLRIRENAPGNIGQHLRGSAPIRQHQYLSAEGTIEQAAYLQMPSPGGDVLTMFDSNCNQNDPALSFLNAGEAGEGDEAIFYDSCTDTDTSSDDEEEPLDWSDCAGYSPDEISQWLFFQQRFHKRRWRRWTRKPVRRVRRFIKKRTFHRRKSFGGRGRPKGRGKGSLFLTYADEWDEALTYLGGSSRSSGKGFGRKTNPRGKDGKIMTCHNCGSEDHFKSECPQSSHLVRRSGKGRRGKGKGGHGPTFLSHMPSPESMLAGSASPASSAQPAASIPVQASAQAITPVAGATTALAVMPPAAQPIASPPGIDSTAYAVGGDDWNAILAPSGWYAAGEFPNNEQTAAPSNEDPAGPIASLLAGNPTRREAANNTISGSMWVGMVGQGEDPLTNNDAWAGQRLGTPSTAPPAQSQGALANLWSAFRRGRSSSQPPPSQPRNTELLLGEGSSAELRPMGLLNLDALRGPPPNPNPGAQGPVVFPMATPKGVPAKAAPMLPPEPVHPTVPLVKAPPLYPPIGEPVLPMQASSAVQGIGLRPEMIAASSNQFMGRTVFQGNADRPDILVPMAEQTGNESPFIQAARIAAQARADHNDPPRPSPAGEPSPLTGTPPAQGPEVTDYMIGGRLGPSALPAYGPSVSAASWLSQFAPSMYRVPDPSLPWQGQETSHLALPARMYAQDAAEPPGVAFNDIQGRPSENYVRERAFQEAEREYIRQGRGGRIGRGGGRGRRSHSRMHAENVANNLQNILYQPRTEGSQRPFQRTGVQLPVIASNPHFLSNPQPSVFAQTTLRQPERSAYTAERRALEMLNNINLTRMYNTQEMRDNLTMHTEPYGLGNDYRTAVTPRSSRDQSLHTASESGSSGPPPLERSTSPGPRVGYGGAPSALHAPQVNVRLHEWDETQCAYCLNDFATGDLMCRLQCRHAFHHQCRIGHEEASHPLVNCSVCRCVGRRISCWRFVSHVAPVTQIDPTTGQPAPNLMPQHEVDALNRLVSPEEVEGQLPTTAVLLPSPGEHASMPNAGPSSGVEYVDSGVASAAAGAATLLHFRRAADDRAGPVSHLASVLSPPPAKAVPASLQPRERAPSVVSSADQPASSVHSQATEFQRARTAESIRIGSSDSSAIDVTLDQTYMIGMPCSSEDAQGWLEASQSTVLGGSDEPEPVVLQSFNVDTRLGNGEHGLLVDIGSLGNLAGDVWVQEVAADGMRHGRKPSETKRERPLKVSGVGNGSQAATFNCKLPIALEQTDGNCEGGHFDTPTVSNSSLPGLLGLTSLTAKRAVIDLTTNTLHFLGPGEPQWNFPEGTVSYQLKKAPSGHLMLPCSKFGELDKQQAAGKLQLDREEVNLLAETPQ